MIRIVLVHGTGDGAPVSSREIEQGKEPKWWQAESPLREEFSGFLVAEDEISFDEFQWDVENAGANSEQARTQGARDLADYLAERNNQNEKVILIGHSHGGNVIEQALRHMAGRRRNIDHVLHWLTVGTPFLNFRSTSWVGRNANYLIGLSVAFLILLASVFDPLVKKLAIAVNGGDPWPLFLIMAPVVFLAGAALIAAFLRWRRDQQATGVTALLRDVLGRRTTSLYAEPDEAIAALNGAMKEKIEIAPPRVFRPVELVVSTLISIGLSWLILFGLPLMNKGEQNRFAAADISVLTNQVILTETVNEKLDALYTDLGEIIENYAKGQDGAINDINSADDEIKALVEHASKEVAMATREELSEALACIRPADANVSLPGFWGGFGDGHKESDIVKACRLDFAAVPRIKTDFDRAFASSLAEGRSVLKIWLSNSQKRDEFVRDLLNGYQLTEESAREVHCGNFGKKLVSTDRACENAEFRRLGDATRREKLLVAITQEIKNNRPEILRKKWAPTDIVIVANARKEMLERDLLNQIQQSKSDVKYQSERAFDEFADDCGARLPENRLPEQTLYFYRDPITSCGARKPGDDAKGRVAIVSRRDIDFQSVGDAGVAKIKPDPYCANSWFYGVEILSWVLRGETIESWERAGAERPRPWEFCPNQKDSDFYQDSYFYRLADSIEDAVMGYREKSASSLLDRSINIAAYFGTKTGVAFILIFFGVIFLASRIVGAASQAIDNNLRDVIDDVVGKGIRAFAFGANDRDKIVAGVTTNSSVAAPQSQWRALPCNTESDLGAELEAISNKAIADNIGEIRRTLTKHLNEGALAIRGINLIVGNLTWAELIHTTYFKSKNFRAFIAYCLTRAETGLTGSGALKAYAESNRFAECYAAIAPVHSIETHAGGGLNGLLKATYRFAVGTQFRRRRPAASARGRRQGARRRSPPASRALAR